MPTPASSAASSSPPMGTTQVPKETPETAFEAAPDQDPMRNFGFTVAAYAILWLVVLAFVLRSWMRQGALEARVASVEAALKKAAETSYR